MRPFLVLSDGRHPFYGDEYIVVGLTTTERNEAIKIRQHDWEEKNIPKDSYASPWFILTVKHMDIQTGVGSIKPGKVDKISEAVESYI
ncbi:MAG: hypothetical protein SXQ77_07495 [Halobacteria archaeon]|nr:hypothetical protein [Halobacteria archaeon]